MVCTGEMRKAHNVLDGSHQEKDHLVSWCVDERIALKIVHGEIVHEDLN